MPRFVTVNFFNPSIRNFPVPIDLSAKASASNSCFLEIMFPRNEMISSIGE